MDIDKQEKKPDWFLWRAVLTLLDLADDLTQEIITLLYRNAHQGLHYLESLYS